LKQFIFMAKTVNCPTCSKSVEWSEASPFRPFCSNRCKQIDLGAWANEQYAIPAVTPPDEPGQTEAM
jgi:endogenous inhibitor of DNA gyrase (YacG/DUF329 family)